VTARKAGGERTRPSADARATRARATRAREATEARPRDRWRDAPEDAHEWVSFPDPDYERTWTFDVTFLESRWTCIYGRGCQGVLTGPAPELEHGCCSYGAHITGGKDARRVQAAATTLTRGQWQYFDKARKAGSKSLKVLQRNDSGELVTKLVKGACIFLNRPGFPGGAGCALHSAALERGVAPLKLKPDVCWQLPLRRDDEVAEGGYVTSVIRQWDRRDWGEGGAEFHWWCTESPEAFVGVRPVFRELEDELVELVGRKIYRKLVAYLEARDREIYSGSGNGIRSRTSRSSPSSAGRSPKSAPEGGTAATPVRLPHPALRSR
jgi:hypothetical protein